MGTFPTVRAVDLLVAAGALAGAFAALAALRRILVSRGPRADGIAHALVTALGDGALLLDGRGRIVHASAEAARLAGVEPEALAGEELAVLGPDLPVLARGLSRGPSSGVVALRGPAGSPPVRARAALVRVAHRPTRDLVVLRREPPAQRPPPLPARGARAGPSAPADAVEPAEARAGLVAAAEAVREPLARAARAASLVRLTAPPLGARCEASVAALESALAEAERRLAALVSAAQPGARRALDLAALVEDVVGALAPPAGVRLRTDLRAARVLGDDRALRAALREVVHAAADALPGGGVVVVSVRGEGGPVVELAGAARPAVAALARALLAPHGARVTLDPGDLRLRIALPAAPAEAAADALAPA